RQKATRIVVGKNQSEGGVLGVLPQRVRACANRALGALKSGAGCVGRTGLDEMTRWLKPAPVRRVQPALRDVTHGRRMSLRPISRSSKRPDPGKIPCALLRLLSRLPWP